MIDFVNPPQMISAEAPVLFAKAAQIFITELTLRAWIHTEDNKRRTLQVSTRISVFPFEHLLYRSSDKPISCFEKVVWGHLKLEF